MACGVGRVQGWSDAGTARCCRDAGCRTTYVRNGNNVHDCPTLDVFSRRLYWSLR